jgi:imidazoleglycerol-phosphate dehydratase
MLEQLALNARFDLTLTASGDIDIDDHHVVEDIAISLGRALADALGDKVGSTRYGHVILPMDEVVTTVACDLSGRFSYRFDASFEYAKVGDMSAQMVKHFWGSFAQNAKINLYVKSEFGDNDHHIAEGIFKACGRALRMACELDSRLSQQLPSTKGFL